MEASPGGAPTPSDTSHSPSPLQLFRSARALRNFGFSNDDILVLSKLGSAGAHRVVELYEHEGPEAAHKLLGSLEGAPEDTLREWLEEIATFADKTSDSDKRKRPKILSRRLSAAGIDNKTDATAPATPYLCPPSARRGSTCTTSPSPSVSTSLTHYTHTPSEKRPKATPKSARKQLYCPACGSPIKNGFDKHFRNHCLPHLFARQVPGEVEWIGCGYCPCPALVVDQGKAFPGVTALIRHVHDVHSQPDSPAPSRLRWDFDASFKNLLSFEENIRRSFLAIVNRGVGRQPANASSYDVTPELSWIESDDTRQILSELQRLAAGIKGVLFSEIPVHDADRLRPLLERAYYAAHKPQLGSASSSSQLPLQRPQQNPPSRPPLNRMEGEELHFATMGRVFDDDVKSMSHLSNSPRGIRLPQTFLDRQSQRSHPNNHDRSWQRPMEPSNQSFAHSAPRSACVSVLAPAADDNRNSISEICNELGVQEGNLYDRGDPIDEFTHLGRFQ